MRRIGEVEYVRVKSLEEAVSLLAEGESTSRPLAGGTDLLVAMKEKNLNVRRLVDLKGISGLDVIVVDEKTGGQIGALCPIHRIATSRELSSSYPVLTEAALQLGSYQVRNRATLGGNICNASPSAEMAPVLLVLESVCTVAGKQGVREVRLADFFLGPGKTVLLHGELLTGVRFDRIPPGTGAAYLKFGQRRAMDIAVVNVAALLTIDGEGKCRQAKIGLGSVASTPIRSGAAEDVLRGSIITAGLLEKAAREAAGDVSPIDDIRASAAYRRELVEVLTRRALEKAWQSAQGLAGGEYQCR